MNDIPKLLRVSATSRCGCNCIHCSYRRDNDDLVRQDLPYRIISDTISASEILMGKHSPQKPAILLGGGGEFTSHPERWFIVDDLIKSGFSLSLETNGSNYNEVVAMAKVMHRIFLEYMGPGHDQLCGVKGSRENTIMLLASVSHTVLKVSIGPWALIGMDRFIKDLKSAHDVTGKKLIVTCTHGIGYRAEKRMPIIDRRQLAKIIKEIADITDEVSLNYLNLVVLGKRLPCYSIHDIATILESGEVMICGGTINSIGNIYLDSFDDIWFSEKNKRARQAAHACKTCFLYDQMSYDVMRQMEHATWQ